MSNGGGHISSIYPEAEIEKVKSHIDNSNRPSIEILRSIDSRPAQRHF